ncbi:7TM diverse intracellular signaling domain-containing protein [Winogradskyella sp. SYSU M77433]|uniref:sensor histidine kinase n=1 Tax=Winogradskyella sp. SYSU M77433 TaxID=3042722 RepID=UPI0024804B74|nr:7TM diverse intracellular signaling domain-containing protein [Winogradskyella sp. SYSU M77433]MDH7913778.1 7TM diverse intracellular signaling domain-containing protein [Winogradskyella sp. SYSU M77433]
MKKVLSNLTILFVLLDLCSFHSILAQVTDTLRITSEFQKANLKTLNLVNNSSVENKKDFFYSDYEREVNIVDFNLKNETSKSCVLILELSNALINEVSVLKKNNGLYKLLYETGIKYPVSQKAFSHRLFAFPLNLEANEFSNYRIVLKKDKGKPLVTSILIKNDSLFTKENTIQQISLGIYFGISILSIVFSLLVFCFVKKWRYLIYGLYIIFLGLYITAYTGLFSQILLPKNDIFNTYTNYILFSEVSLILFVLFSQRFLEAKKYAPRLKQLVDIFLIACITLRILIHFTTISEAWIHLFVKLWYFSLLVLGILIAFQIVAFLKTNFKKTSFFALAYIFMIVGVCCTILYHGFGIINGIVFGLPIIFYTSFLEILFLTLSVILMVKDIYDQRNRLSEKLILEERKSLSAFMKGEDQERKRISKELHDNVGSQLSYLKRFISENVTNQAISDSIDNICKDVRNLSHEISPSDLKFVGLEKAIKDLVNTLKSNTSIAIEFYTYKFPTQIDDETELQLYRIVQEVLNNIIKHSEASEVNMQLIGHNTYAIITIEDNGKGFVNIGNTRGLGLRNIALRAKQIGGSVEIDSKEKQGTSIIITFPT